MKLGGVFWLLCALPVLLHLSLQSTGSLYESLYQLGLVEECYEYPDSVGVELTAAEPGTTVLVTGAAGFIGSHVARHCAALGLKVIILDDLSGGFRANVPEGITFVVGDVKNATLLDELFTEHKFTYVYHLAAYAAEGLSHFIRSYNYRNNLVGSVELLNQAIKHDVKCFIFTSSIAVFGAGQTPMTEQTVPLPEDPYGISKYAFELDLRAAHDMFDMDFIIFRPHNVYGPGQNIFDKYRNVLGIFMLQLLQQNPLTIFGDGLQTRCFSYIDDVAPMIAQAPLLSPEKVRNQVYNLGSDTATNLNTLATQVSDAMGVEEVQIKYLPARLEVKHAISDHRKLQCYFKPPAYTSLAEGLKATVAWVKETGNTFNPVEFAGVEIKRQMPGSWVSDTLQEVNTVEHTGADNLIEQQYLRVQEQELSSADDEEDDIIA